MHIYLLGLCPLRNTVNISIFRIFSLCRHCIFQYPFATSKSQNSWINLRLFSASMAVVRCPDTDSEPSQNSTALPVAISKSLFNDGRLISIEMPIDPILYVFQLHVYVQEGKRIRGTELFSPRCDQPTWIQASQSVNIWQLLPFHQLLFGYWLYLHPNSFVVVSILWSKEVYYELQCSVLFLQRLVLLIVIFQLIVTILLAFILVYLTLFHLRKLFFSLPEELWQFSCNKSHWTACLEGDENWSFRFFAVTERKSKQEYQT